MTKKLLIAIPYWVFPAILLVLGVAVLPVAAYNLGNEGYSKDVAAQFVAAGFGIVMGLVFCLPVFSRYKPTAEFDFFIIYAFDHTGNFVKPYPIVIEDADEANSKWTEVKAGFWHNPNMHAVLMNRCTDTEYVESLCKDEAGE